MKLNRTITRVSELERLSRASVGPEFTHVGMVIARVQIAGDIKLYIEMIENSREIEDGDTHKKQGPSASPVQDQRMCPGHV